MEKLVVFTIRLAFGVCVLVLVGCIVAMARSFADGDTGIGVGFMFMSVVLSLSLWGAWKKMGIFEPIHEDEERR